MLSFTNSNSQLTGLFDYLSPTGLIALLLSFGATMAVARTRGDQGFYALLLLLHIGSSLTYYNYTLQELITDAGDAVGYYTAGFSYREFGTSTQFINFIMSFLHRVTNPTYLDSFLMFQFFGFLGIILLHRVATKMSEDGFAARATILSVILLTPGLHFWTSAIGKDSLAIFAYTLIALGLGRERPHIAILLSGLLLYFLVRPYIGFFLICAMMFAFLSPIGSTPSRFRWLGLWAVFGTLLLMPSVFQTIGIAGGSISNAIAYLEDRQNYQYGGGTDYIVTDLTPPERIFKYMFSPLFFNTTGFFDLVASFENLLLLIIFIYLCLYLGTLFRLLRASPTLRFHAIFIAIFLAIVGQVTANLGIALRQKIMIFPALFLLLTAVVAYRSRLRQDRRKALGNLYNNPGGKHLEETERRDDNSSGAE